METSSDILSRTSAFVTEIFREQLPSMLTYHDLHHTLDVVEAARRIGTAEGLSDDELEIVLLAAWCHDIGYARTYSGHEAAGAEIARLFLTEQGYPPERIEAVAGCVVATIFPQKPSNRLESVVCDADLSHVGRKGFLDSGDALRQEWAAALGMHYTDSEWLENNLKFLHGHSFHTASAVAMYGQRKRANIEKVEKRLRKLREREPVHATAAAVEPVEPVMPGDDSIVIEYIPAPVVEPPAEPVMEPIVQPQQNGAATNGHTTPTDGGPTGAGHHDAEKERGEKNRHESHAAHPEEGDAKEHGKDHGKHHGKEHRDHGHEYSKEARMIVKEIREAMRQEREEERLQKVETRLLEKSDLKEQKERRPDRGIETMFRLTSQNHMDLSRMADDKANTLIQINTLIISIVLSVLFSKLDANEYLLYPTIVLLASAVLTIVFATLATRPKVNSGTFTQEDVRQRKVNLLFFGNFYNMSLEDYSAGMNELMTDKQYLYGTLTKDIYFLGQVLGRKYRLLRQGYTIFMYGIILSVLAFMAALI